jgi:glycosyltransferase involved in cell wall biosynthesis
MKAGIEIGRAAKSKVIFIGPRPPPVHGQAMATLAVCEGLRRAGVPLVVCDTSEGVRDHRWSGTVGRIITYLVAAGKVGLFRRATVYSTANSGSGIAMTAFICLAARLRKRRFFLHHHSYSYVARRWAPMAFVARLAGKNATHIVLSPSMGADFTASTPEVRRFLVLNNAGLVDPALRAFPLRQRETRSITLGHICNLSRAKGTDTTVDAALAARKAGFDIRLIIAGPTGDAAAQAAIERAAEGLGRDFEYRGAVYGAAKVAFFAEIDVFLFPSRYDHEAEPLVVLEALAAGVPVIATDRGCIADDIGATGGLAVSETVNFDSASCKFLKEIVPRLSEARYAARTRFDELVALHHQQFDTFVMQLR